MKIILTAALALAIPFTAMAEAPASARVAPAVLTVTTSQPVAAADYVTEARFGRRGGRRGFGRRGFGRRSFARGGFRRGGFGRGGFQRRGFGRNNLSAGRFDTFGFRRNGFK